MQRRALIALVVLLIFALSACSGEDLVAKREQMAFAQRKSIVIGVPVPLEFAKANTNFIEGVQLAQEELNTSGIMGKDVELVIADDRGTFKEAVDLAQEFAKNTNMVAVIGHWFSGVCLPVSAIYEKAGMLTVVPTVSNPELTAKGFQYVFQNIPGDKEIARQMCRYAGNKGYQKIVVYHEDSSYGENLAAAFENAAKGCGVTTVDRISGLNNELALQRSYDKWKALDFDAVFLALNMPEGANFITSFRKLDQETPILAADGLDVANLREVLGEDAEGIVIATLYNPTEQGPQLVEFQKRYQQKYQKEPDVWAIQGYDSLYLLAQAIKETNSASPTVLADYLRNMEAWESVWGSITFNQQGEVQGRTVYKKQVVNGEFQYIE